MKQKTAFSGREKIKPRLDLSKPKLDLSKSRLDLYTSPHNLMFQVQSRKVSIPLTGGMNCALNDYEVMSLYEQAV